MPQLILELSSNVMEKNKITNFFRECHSILKEMLPTDLNSCKSRAIEYNKYYIGDGQPNNAFIHFTVKVMPGRNIDTLQTVGDRLMGELRGSFAESLNKLNLQITLEIIELQKTYFKTTS